VGQNERSSQGQGSQPSLPKTNVPNTHHVALLEIVDSPLKSVAPACSHDCHEVLTLVPGSLEHERSTKWIVDSGATVHVTHQKSLLMSYQTLNDVTVSVANNTREKVQGIGVVKLVMNVDDAQITLTLKNVYYVPCLAYNIFSLHKALQMGLEVVFQPPCCIFSESSTTKIIAWAFEEGGLYVLDCTALTADKMHTVMLMQNQNTALRLWHQRFGHAGQKAIIKLANNNLVVGMERISATSTLEDCVGCSLGKQARRAFHSKSTRSRASRPLELVHSDLCGPMSKQTLGGGAYFMTFVDDYTRKVWL
jgi:hypothetical protein